MVNLKQNNNLFKKEIDDNIENIFSKSTDFGEIKKEVINLLTAYKEQYHINLNNARTNDSKQNLSKGVNSNVIKVISKSNNIKLIRNIEGELDKKNTINITKKSKKDLKEVIKMLVIHELYKVMNPKKIAGESKKANFINNNIIYGDKVAKKYDYGITKKYSGQKLEKIKNQVRKVKFLLSKKNAAKNL